MHILNIIQGTGLGGMEQSSLRLMNEMSKSGFSFSVLSLTEIGQLKAHLDANGISYQGGTYKGPGGIFSYFDYRKIIKESNSEGIMMTGNSLVAMAAISNICKNKRLLFVHYHHSGVKSKIVWKLIYFIANLRFKHIFFASNFIMQEALTLFPKIKKKSSCLNNPLKPVELIKESERKVIRDSLGISQDRFIIGNAGWLIKRKRFDILLRVCAELKKDNEKITVLIAGEGEEKNSLLKLADGLNIADDVVWLGWVSDMRKFYSAIDIMIFNSDWDAVGLSPLEAIQHGIPTFSSILNGGLKELIPEEYSYFIQDTHDIKELQNKIEYTSSNFEEITNQTLGLRKHINNISNPEFIAKKVAEKYR